MTGNFYTNGIEFNGSSTHGGYIDFHYGKSTKDYTRRIIEESDGIYIYTLSTSKKAKITTGNSISI